MYAVAAPIRSEKIKALRHNTKQGISPLDAPDAIIVVLTNHSRVAEGTRLSPEGVYSGVS